MIVGVRKWSVDNEFLTGIIIGGDNMAVCYKKLWKMLIDKDMIKKTYVWKLDSAQQQCQNYLRWNVSMDVIEKICMVLNCDVGDIMEFVPGKKEGQ